MTKGKQVADGRERRLTRSSVRWRQSWGATRARAYEAFGKRNPLWAEFERVASALKGSADVVRFPNVVARSSAGQGRWATVPWIAALDSRETSKTSEGVYVIYLFRADMSGVYLTLNQGTSWVMAGYGGSGPAQLRERAAQLRLAQGRRLRCERRDRPQERRAADPRVPRLDGRLQVLRAQPDPR